MQHVLCYAAWLCTYASRVVRVLLILLYWLVCSATKRKYITAELCNKRKYTVVLVSSATKFLLSCAIERKHGTVLYMLPTPGICIAG